MLPGHWERLSLTPAHASPMAAQPMIRTRMTPTFKTSKQARNRPVNQWGQGPSGVSQRFGNAGLYDIQRASESLQHSVDADSADKIQKYTNKITDEAAAIEDQKKRAQGGEVMKRYNKPPRNGPNNDHHQGHPLRLGTRQQRLRCWSEPS
jgi:hypothetical protein